MARRLSARTTLPSARNLKRRATSTLHPAMSHTAWPRSWPCTPWARTCSWPLTASLSRPLACSFLVLSVAAAGGSCTRVATIRSPESRPLTEPCRSLCMASAAACRPRGGATSTTSTTPLPRSSSTTSTSTRCPLWPSTRPLRRRPRTRSSNGGSGTRPCSSPPCRASSWLSGGNTTFTPGTLCAPSAFTPKASCWCSAISCSTVWSLRASPLAQLSDFS
mmetsp:Transcript_13039/g.37911  ORF Transcript_13039/g.37911 Transcript_13039/m.37911 type:complete len:220 (+) Transcript_13039:285-944(+)